jgi:toxin FitB
MIILDTNVVSEPIKLKSDRAVEVWLDQQIAETLYLTAASLSELHIGLEILPLGKRKAALSAALDEMVAKLFGDRILPFDRQAAITGAKLLARARAEGRKISFGDGQIAAIAATHGFTVATRDTTPFEAAGIPVINPWRS